ncbi:putative bifunctional diguanylate cyclase/phosphodiesterase [Alteromonas sp. AMM-1]|uniref:putative bifunctional diguanylate cyclase/phosphodiesterase n=1 Tax=Alteromonas sp. AMM-1 TaxID=3394233 RepID=UPI0039A7229B
MPVQPITQINRDTSVRPRLIVACLVVSVLVSAIYVTVSYRLTADVSLQTELHAMEKLARMLSSELTLREGSIAEQADPLINILSDPNDDTPRLFHIQGAKESWQRGHRLSKSEQANLLKLVSRDQNKTHLIEESERSFLWQHFTGENNTVTFIQQTTAMDTTLSFVAKRLLITSVLVFWIAVWLALTLSSLIAKRAEEINETLATIATHDALTGLPNRLYLMDKLTTALLKPHASTAVSEASVFVIDLDKFKEVNDSFGHSAGDTLLKEVATRLLDIVLPPAELIRIGGDEFIIWAPGLSIEQAEALAIELVGACDTPIMINGLAVNTGASIGISHYPTHANEPEALIVCADTAMYKAKEQRNGWQVYDDNKIADYKHNLQLRAELHDAILQQQFILHYQPKVDLGSGCIVGVEGLCRWEHPRLGLLMPGHFIDLIEDSGKVQEFGRYVIAKVIEQAAYWQQQGIAIPIAVNLSPYNLLDPGLVSFIQQQLTTHKVAPELIEIELTENETSLNIKYIKAALDNIRELGISLAIDDFGTGMSSLAYLAHLNVNVLKIDRAFVTDIEVNTGHKAIVASAITLAQSFGCSMVAEGVETLSQATLLHDMGCRVAQGYLFSKPMPEAKVKQQILSGKTLYPHAQGLESSPA